MTKKENLIEQIKEEMDQLKMELEDIFQVYLAGELEIPESFGNLQDLIEELEED